MKIQFGWYSKRSKRKQHMVSGENRRTLCLMENGSRHIPDTFSEKPHPKREICGTCMNIYNRGEAKKKRKKIKRVRPPVDSFLKSREWKEVRYRALQRSDGRCECCGAGPRDGAVLQVDHVKPRKTHPELALSIGNLQVLCASCNWGKGNDDTDWREPRLTVLMGNAIDE